MNTSKFWSFLILIFLPIILWQCYWYVEFNQIYIKLLHWIVVLILLIYFANSIIKKGKNIYNQYIRFIIVFYLTSIVMALLYWDQSPSLTFRASVGPLTMLYFFVLQKNKINEKELLRVIFFFAVIYIILWIYALSQAPRVLFGNLEEVTDDRGFFRVLQLPSLDTVCLLYFISLVQYLKRIYNFYWLFLCAACFIVIFFSLSRMLIFSIALVSVLFILRKKIILGLIIGGVVIVGLDRLSQNEIVSSMIEMTNNQVQENEENNLRITEYKNMFTAYPFHMGTMLLGNGDAHVQSDYGTYNELLKQNLGFHRSDAGYVGIYTTYGLCMLVLLLVILLHVFRTFVPMDYQPFRLFVLFLFLHNLTSYSFWGYGISFSFSLYALSLAEQQSKISK